MRESAAPGGPVYVWDGQDEISIYRVVQPLVRHWGWIAGLALAFAGAAAAYTLASPPSYTSSARFYAQSETSSPLAGVSGLAAQFGIDVGTREAGRSPEFYADLLTSEGILDAAVRTPYTVTDTTAASGTREGDLVALFGVEGETPEVRLERAREFLRNEVLDVGTDRDTGVITASATTPWPDLSAAIGGRLLELLEAFNLETRRSQAAMQRTFVEERLEESRRDLLAAEDSLQRFLERTRRLGTSPTLTFERDRLRRQVDLRQQLFTSLAESHQRARIEEVRDIPVITVVDLPAAPARPDDPRLLLRVVLGLMLGGMVGTGFAYGRAFVERAEEERDEEYDDLVREVRRAFDGPRRAARRVRSLLPGGEGS